MGGGSLWYEKTQHHCVRVQNGLCYFSYVDLGMATVNQGSITNLLDTALVGHPLPTSPKAYRQSGHSLDQAVTGAETAPHYLQVAVDSWSIQGHLHSSQSKMANCFPSLVNWNRSSLPQLMTSASSHILKVPLSQSCFLFLIHFSFFNLVMLAWHKQHHDE